MSGSITCPQCGRQSWHPEDVRRAYCGACHLFHDEMLVRRSADLAARPDVAGFYDALRGHLARSETMRSMIRTSAAHKLAAEYQRAVRSFQAQPTGRGMRADRIYVDEIITWLLSSAADRVWPDLESVRRSGWPGRGRAWHTGRWEVQQPVLPLPHHDERRYAVDCGQRWSDDGYRVDVTPGPIVRHRPHQQRLNDLVIARYLAPHSPRRSRWRPNGGGA
jgi:hypothetical protein